MTDPKTEYLESRMEMQAAINLVLDGAELVQQGGVDGIVTAAATQPEMILAAFHSLATVVKIQNEEINSLIEDRFEVLDYIEKNSKQ